MTTDNNTNTPAVSISDKLRALLDTHWAAYNIYTATSLAADEDDATDEEKDANERANDALKAAFDALREYRPRNITELLAKVERINSDDWGLSHLPQVIEDLRALVGKA